MNEKVQYSDGQNYPIWLKVWEYITPNDATGSVPCIYGTL